MASKFDRIKQDAKRRVLRNNDGNPEFLLYLDHRSYKRGETLDLKTERLEFDRQTQVVFVDDEPGKNFGHRCHYLLYDAKTGRYLRKVRVNFPHFMSKKPDNIELFRTCETAGPFRRRRRMRQAFDLPRISAYAKLAPFPLRFRVRGRRYAILYSGDSNGRHVNDLEFLYRTLVDVYGYDPADIYVLNHDGTVNYERAVWSNGWTEPDVSNGFGPDGSAYRMVVNGQGNRTGFQNAVSDLASRIRPLDCLLIHTNNHGWFDGNGGFLSAFGPGVFHASDFVADLATLPQFKTLLVAMEQCASGSFSQPIMDNSPATDTVFQAAVPGNQSSAGGWPFDPWAEMWISAMAGVRGDGTPLAVSPDDDLNTLISAWEAYDYSSLIDNPVMAESSPGLSDNVYLCRCSTAVKPSKEWKEPKEAKELKEFHEPKEVFEPKQITEPKLFKEPKAVMEGKHFYEGPEHHLPYERLHLAYEGLLEHTSRLERLVKKLTPFIEAKQRPDLKRKAKGKR